MFKISSFFPSKTKDKSASTQSLMSISTSHVQPKIQTKRILQKSVCRSTNLSPIKILQSKQNNLEKKSASKIKKTLNLQLFKDSFYRIEEQIHNKKEKNIFRINGKKKSLDCLIIDHRKKLRESKLSPRPQILKSSNLPQLYIKLYESYEKVPFEEYNKQEGKCTNDENISSLQLKQGQRQKETKKQFETKEVAWQNNLRKEIKSLTRDTDNILNMEFHARDSRRR